MMKLASALVGVHLEWPEGSFIHIPLKSAECWSESLKLFGIAEATVVSKELDSETPDFAETSNRFIFRRRGILRPAISLKHLNILIDNAQKSLPCCKTESLDRDATQNLVPSLCVPLNLAFYMPEAINVHPQRYLKALLLVCEDLAKDLSTSGLNIEELHLHKMSVNNLLELVGTQTYCCFSFL
ncbi:uncharacterized protein LOC131318933 isoform X2 [Rhododendron vialii]|nr:uncharacterized protein LOC131318933 isoform X2 [Rhododendron vialii]